MWELARRNKGVYVSPRLRILDARFQLNVFCDECGNRAKPIVYGMPGPDEPKYLALGGCNDCAAQLNPPPLMEFCQSWGQKLKTLAFSPWLPEGCLGRRSLQY